MQDIKCFFNCKPYLSHLLIEYNTTSDSIGVKLQEKKTSLNATLQLKIGTSCSIFLLFKKPSIKFKIRYFYNLNFRKFWMEWIN